ncbi:MAG: 16S rRNA (cytosine(967)-C(5))-methyltransferase RsmB, partial [Gammaproteobacteria bacterium]|nr:16S rRNA (cytosine(967)-C(5))-methyltransferase RsmB [Gammaproteobacteria bacterium]
MSEPERGAATRALAARAVMAVLRQGTTLDEALRHADIADVGALSGPDRAQVRLLAFGAVRGHQRHRALLRRLLHRPLGREQYEIEALLSVGLYQLLDDEQPDYAAVSATVAAARWLGRPRAAGLVNAALRRAQRERTGLLESVLATDEGRFCAPAWLIERLRQDWPGQWPDVLDAALRPPPLWLRVNRLKRDEASYFRRLAEAGLDAERCAD